ncbi:MAG: hypothetical protein JNL98_34015 [Bryobacterales bacterium]|nr:hypothetical protein [Bryobacterales bacterium]
MASGEFWTRAVAGKTIVIELHTNDFDATLPFRLEDVAEVDAIEESAELDSRPDVEIRTSWFRGSAVQHHVVDGMAIWEGDILLGRAEELERAGKPGEERFAGAVSGSSYRWPNGIVPYTIHPSLPNQSRITAAISHWNTSLAPNVKLVPRTNETYYITFVPASPTTCSSYLGMVRMAGQPVNIGDYCSTGNVIHEIGHAIGLYHEHTRSDRDGYVRIRTENIQSSASYNFGKQASTNFGNYDYNSIMHYSAYAFSSNGQPTIETIPAGIAIGQRNTLSTGDVAGVRGMYPQTGTTTVPPATVPPTTPPPVPPPPTASTVAISFTSAPAGRTVQVDNAATLTPKTLQWQAGSAHTISAPNTTENGARYVFRQWSDGGAQTHTITTPASARTYTATYNVLYNLVANASAGGRVAVNPAASDGYYPANSTVALTATPNANYCFTSWTGVMPVASSAIAVALSRPATITANFQVGSITAPSSITVPAAGGAATVNISATSGCLWRAASYASWIKVENATGTTSAALRLQVERNPSTTVRRIGYLLLNSQLIVVTQ